jgi:hypothetical protein
LPKSSSFIKTLRVARLAWCGAGLLAAAGCGPPELGSVKLPAELSRGAKPAYGPGAAKAGLRQLGPGQFQVAQKTKPGRRGGSELRPRSHR